MTWQRLLPPLAWSHPNFALAALVVGAMHTAAFTDGLFGGRVRHSAPAWETFRDLGGVALWGCFHGLVVALLAIGIYTRFSILRLGCILSVGVWTSTGVAFTFVAATEPRSTWLGASYAFGWAALSFCCLLEPEHNPANERRRNGR